MACGCEVTFPIINEKNSNFKWTHDYSYAYTKKKNLLWIKELTVGQALGNYLNTQAISSHNNHGRVEATICVLLQMRKLRPREAKDGSRDHPAGKWQSGGLASLKDPFCFSETMLPSI